MQSFLQPQIRIQLLAFSVLPERLYQLSVSRVQITKNTNFLSLKYVILVLNQHVFAGGVGNLGEKVKLLYFVNN